MTDIRCAWCEKPEDRIHAGSLLSHFKSHRGRNNRNGATDSFWMTLSFAKSFDAEILEEEIE